MNAHKRKRISGHVRFVGVPRSPRAILLLALLSSLLFHAGSYINLVYIADHKPVHLPPTSLPVKIQVKPNLRPKTDQDHQKIVEVQQVPTEAPKDARFKGAQNHKTDKETKVAEKRAAPKGADPGQGLVNSQGAKAGKPQAVPKTKIVETKTRPIKNQGKMEFGEARPKPRNNYENLMPTGNDLAGMMKAGYQDYISDKMAVGDRVDINTADYRYIGYFTSMRKAIELVWNYPYEAIQRGLQGEVGLEFTIFKDGSVKNIKVIQTSGYDALDRAIVDAIKLASPYSPLPNGIAKGDRLTITGSFRYVLTTSYAGG